MPAATTAVSRHMGEIRGAQAGEQNATDDGVVSNPPAELPTFVLEDADVQYHFVLSHLGSFPLSLIPTWVPSRLGSFPLRPILT